MNKWQYNGKNPEKYSKFTKKLGYNILFGARAPFAGTNVLCNEFY